MRALALAVVVGTFAVLCPPAPSPAAAIQVAAEPIVYRPPVDAVIVDPFRPPPGPYASGNRGVDYATAPGVPVRAAARGEVRFAGQVGGVLHITVEHPDGRLSTYSGVGEIGVRVGDRVDRGQVIALTGGVLHLGVREDGRYIDPEALFDAPMGARLVPESPVEVAGSWTSPGREAAALRLVALELSQRRPGPLGVLGRLGGSLIGGAGAWAGRSLDAGLGMLALPVDGTRWLGGSLAQVASVALPVLWHLAPYVAARYNPVLAGVVFGIVVPLLQGQVPPIVGFGLDLARLPVRLVERGHRWWQHRSNCTPGDVDPPAPAGDRVAVLVAGLDSTSDGASISDLRTDELGYQADQVIGFSYAGGRTPGRFGADPADAAGSSGPGGPLAGLAVNPYGTDESSTGLVERGALLADLLAEVAAADPDATVDLYAHSQGGLVVRSALHELEQRPGGTEVIDRLGLVATMGTPHTGSDLAAISVVLSDSLPTSAALRTADLLTGTTLHPRGTNVADLARWSDLAEVLSAHRLPPGPAYLTLANRADPIVTDERARIDGVTHVTLGGTGPTAHSTLPGQDDTTRELALGLAGLPPTCQGLGHFLVDVAVSEGVQLAVSGLGLATAVHTLPISPIDVLEPLVRW